MSFTQHFCLKIYETIHSGILTDKVVKLVGAKSAINRATQTCRQSGI